MAGADRPRGAVAMKRTDSESAAGYTLIELLIVMTLVVVLASMAMGQYRTSVLYARESVLKRDLFVMRDAFDQYYADKGEYPPTLQALSDEGYIRRVVKDPITDRVETWQIVPDEPASSRLATPGVYDVKSGSDKIALDGSRYADW